MGDNGGFPCHSMSKLYQNNSKTSMVIPHLFGMDEILVVQRICLQVLKKIALLLHLGVSHLNDPSCGTSKRAHKQRVLMHGHQG